MSKLARWTATLLFLACATPLAAEGVKGDRLDSIARPVPVQETMERPKCGPLFLIEATLRDQYGETMALTAITNDGKARLNIYASPLTGTMTALTVTPDGKACFSFTGNAITPTKAKRYGPGQNT